MNIDDLDDLKDEVDEIVANIKEIKEDIESLEFGPGLNVYDHDDIASDIIEQKNKIGAYLDTLNELSNDNPSDELQRYIETKINELDL